MPACSSSCCSGPRGCSGAQPSRGSDVFARQHLDIDYRRQLRLFPSWASVLVGVATVVGLVAAPYLIGNSVAGIGLAAVNNALIAIIGAVALNLLVGFTGLLSMGHAAF